MISQNMLDALMNNTNRLIYFKDLEGRYTFVNREWLRQAGVEADRVNGRTDHEIFGPVWGDIFRGNDLKVLQTLEPIDFEEEVTLADGTTVIHHSIKFPVFNEQGAPCGTGGISSDITERKRLEASLRHSNQTKDKFFSIIAHDLKTPLSGLLGLTDLLLDDVELANPRHFEKEIRLINQTTKVLHNLLDNLLTWARSQTGLLEYEPRRLPFCALLRECVQLVQPSLVAKELTLEVDCVEGMEVVADAQMTSTILRNLLANAIKYSWPGGTVRVVARPEGGFVVLEVQDEGVGIPAERLQSLFCLASKSSTPGTRGELGSGLGLLLCKDFAERQQGWVEVESTLGRGSTMRMKIPGGLPGATGHGMVAA